MRKLSIAKLLLLLYVFIIFSCIGYGQKKWTGNAGDGLWMTTSNWSSGTLPTSSDDVILDNTNVSGNYSVTLNNASQVTVKSVQIGYAGNTNTLTLIVSGGTTNLLTINGGGSSALHITNGGILNNQSSSSTRGILLSTASDVFKMSGTAHYIHSTTTSGSNIPQRTSGTVSANYDFAITSTFENQSGSTASFDPLPVYGEYTYNKSGTGSANQNLNINGDVSVISGTLNIATSSTSTFTIGGNVSISSGASLQGTSTTGTTTLNITGNVSGAGTLTGNATSNGTTNITIGGNLTSLISFGSGTNNLTFSGGTSPVNFTPANSAIPAFQNVTIGDGTNTKIVKLGTNISIASAKTLLIKNAGSFDCGTNIISGSGTFTLSAGATLKIGSPEGITSNACGTGSTCGNIRSVIRTFDAVANYEYNGSVSQVTGNGSTGANNLIINNPTSVTLNNILAITGAIIFGNVNGSTFNTSNLLTLRSTLSNTAIIADVTNNNANSGNTISGNVTVERYLSSSGNRAYRLLGPSVATSTSIHANWQEGASSRTNDPKPGYGTHITGTTSDQTNGFDATQTGQGSLFTYTNAPAAWVPTANTNVATLDAKTGYLLYIRGDRSIDLSSQSPLPSTNTTLRATGSLLTGTQTYPGLATNNFSLVTNPYASAISWASIYTNNISNFSNYYTYWDPNIGSRGGYVTVTNAGINNMGGVATVNIQSGQAFFVNSITASPTLTIREADKSTTNNIDVFRVTSAAQKFTVSLYYNDAILGRRLADGMTALYDNSYNSSVDGSDAEEINNWDENIAIAREGKHLSIEERPVITVSDTLPLFMNNMKQQAYELEFNPTGLNPNTAARLVDKFTGSSTILNVASTTVVPFTITSDAASSATDRFYVLFSPSSALPISLISVKAYQRNTAVQVDWIVQQEINMDRYEVEHSQNAQAFTKVGSVTANNSGVVSNYSLADQNPFTGVNYYRIKIINKSAQVTYSQVVKVSIGSNPAQVTVSPNPVNGNTVTLQLVNLAKGIYTVSLINKLGQIIQSKVIDHPGGSATRAIVLSKMFTTGVYQLKLSGEAITVTKQVIKN